MKKEWVLLLLLLTAACYTDRGILERGRAVSEDKKPSSPTTPEGQSTPAEELIVLDRDFFVHVVQPGLERDCALCHELRVNGFDEASALVVPGKPSDSMLYKIASGESGHMLVWEENSVEMIALVNWINGGTLTEEPIPTLAAIPTPIPNPTITPPEGAPTPSPTPEIDKKEFFNTKLKALFERDCKRCHRNPAPDYATALTKIKPGDPMNSVLHKKANGRPTHRKIWVDDSMELALLTEWINLEGQE